MPRKKPEAKPAADKIVGNPDAATAKVTAPKTTGATVTVGLKIPNGLVLQLQEKVKVSMPVMGGGYKDVEEYRPMAGVETITLRGTRTPQQGENPVLLVGGFAMNPGVDRDFWAKWLEQNRNLDIVKAGLIFAQDDDASASSHAKEKAAMKSGLEPLHRDAKGVLKDARAGNRIQTADEQKKNEAA